MVKEAYVIYMMVKKSTFYLTEQEIMLWSDHLPLKKFLNHKTLNNTVDNWAVETESFKIKFVHITGKDNVLADILSRLIDIDPDVGQEPELKDYEFAKCVNYGWFVGCTSCTLQTFYAWLVRGLYVCVVGILIYRILHLSLRCDSWYATILLI